MDSSLRAPPPPLSLPAVCENSAQGGRKEGKERRGKWILRKRGETTATDGLRDGKRQKIRRRRHGWCKSEREEKLLRERPSTVFPEEREGKSALSRLFPQKEGKKVEFSPSCFTSELKYIRACSRCEDHVTVSQASVTRRDGT